ncbi:conserved hypothetical protein [Carnobacterium maltaromaticum]|uniref:hypothetical protein n=1 Tax=Carnobacterium maltaromaticum TaxID=2751 RepID=UPI0009D5A81B|nr:hypothetical protein [Carnobacterium maltaromaticum]MBC9787188.1 hypothetical protein [Carnobacterium maltaromaticum]CRH23021.1 conserved hypothetical protein [Carnobacterium maltaromaticum]
MEMTEMEKKEMIENINDYIQEKGYGAKVSVTEAGIQILNKSNENYTIFSIVNNIENNIKTIERNV